MRGLRLNAIPTPYGVELLRSSRAKVLLYSFFYFTTENVIFAPKLLIHKTMTVVSSKEFATFQDKYFDLALSERVFIKKGNHTFFIANVDEDDDFADLMLARDRLNGEFTNADEFISYLRK